MPLDIPAFYLVDHRLIALLMLALLLASAEIGYRLGLAREGAPDSLRTLMSGTGAAMLGLRRNRKSHPPRPTPGHPR